MTEQEKLTLVMSRIKSTEPTFEESYLPVIVIIGFICALQKEGLIESIYQMNEIGNKILTITEEVGWKPTDDQLLQFITEMFAENERTVVLYMTKRYRDDKNNFLEEVKKFKETENL